MTNPSFSSRVATLLRPAALAVAISFLASCSSPLTDAPLVYDDVSDDVGGQVETVYSANHGKHTYSGSYADSEHVQGAGIDSHPRVEAARWFAEGLRGEARALAAERYPRLGLMAATGYGYTSGSRVDSVSSAGTGSQSGYCRPPSSGNVGSGQNGWRWRNEAALVLSQRLFDGRRTRYAEEAGMSRAMAAELSANTVAQTVAIEYSTAQLDYVQAREITAFARHLVDTHENTLALTADKLSRGLQSQADVDLVRSRLKRSQTLLTMQERLMKDAEVRFRSVAGKSPSQVPAPPQPRASDLTALKMNSNWEVKAAEETLRSRQLENESARRLAYPTVDLEVGGRAGDGLYGIATADEEVQALLVLNWDILDGGFRKAERYRTEAGINEARELVKATKLDVRELWDLGSDMRTKSSQAVSELNAYVANLTKAVDAIEADFVSSKLPVLNMLDMQDELFQAKADRVLERTNRLRGEYAMLAASGELVQILEGSGVSTGASRSGSPLASTTTSYHRPTGRSTHTPATTSYHRPASTQRVATRPSTTNVDIPARAPETAVAEVRPAAAPAPATYVEPARDNRPVRNDSVYQRRNPFRNPMGGFSGF